MSDLGIREAPATPEREQGFLLIADMESSTGSKLALGEDGAFGALRQHNQLVMETCRKAAPVEGCILAAFFAEYGLRPTACRSHIGHIEGPADAQLRYRLMHGVYLPGRTGSSRGGS